MSLDWHKKCWVNSCRSADNLCNQIESLTKQLAQLEASNKFHAMQIMEAVNTGKDGFDADKFMKKRKPE